MGAKPFDLKAHISDLLERIVEGRKTVKETQHIRDAFGRALENRENADRLVSQLQIEAAPPDEPAKSQARAKLDDQVAVRKKLTEESDALYLQSSETTKFIGDFIAAVSLLRERLRPTPEWARYRRAIGSLRVSHVGSWTDPPENSALDTLEIRLTEMLDLAIQTRRWQEPILDISVANHPFKASPGEARASFAGDNKPSGDKSISDGGHPARQQMAVENKSGAFDPTFLETPADRKAATARWKSAWSIQDRKCTNEDLTETAFGSEDRSFLNQWQNGKLRLIAPGGSTRVQAIEEVLRRNTPPKWHPESKRSAS